MRYLLIMMLTFPLFAKDLNTHTLAKKADVHEKPPSTGLLYLKGDLIYTVDKGMTVEILKTKEIKTLLRTQIWWKIRFNQVEGWMQAETTDDD